MLTDMYPTASGSTQGATVRSKDRATNDSGTTCAYTHILELQGA
jgi:hypothetical protein